MPRKNNSLGGDSDMAKRLKAKGLGVSFTRIKQNAMNPHSAPLRRTSVKVSQLGKPCTIYPLKPD